MKAIGVTLGTFVLSVVLGTIIILMVALALWILVPGAFPVLHLTYPQSIALAAGLFLLRGVFKN